MSTTQSPTTPEMVRKLKERWQSPQQLLIDGEWGDARAGGTLTSLDPATDEQLAVVSESTDVDVDLAVAAARRAFDHGPWSRMPPSERANLLWRLADLIDEHRVELSFMDALDSGKPLGTCLNGDLPFASGLFRYMAGWATKIEGTTIPLSVAGKQFHSYTRREPVGVVGQIIPWNAPFLMAAWKLAPALATGCTVVLKPAEQTPLSAVRLGELICEAGFPDGVVNVVQGPGETAGAALAAHPGVDKVAFTGSVEVGRKIVTAAADSNLKRVSLELGGKSPNVVFADANLDEAVVGSADAVFYCQGESCTAASRLFVQATVLDEVVSGLVDRANDIRVRPPLDPDADIGPLISAGHRERVLGYIHDGLDAGAELLTANKGGVPESGHFVEPAVLTNVSSAMPIVREEVFGPVVTVMPFADMDDLVQQANDTSYGLAAAIWTADVSKAHRFAASVRAGAVWVNSYNVYDPALPFGGFRQSGWGREMGESALDSYLETKAVTIAL